MHDFFERHRLLLDKADWVHKHASDDLLEYVGDYRTGSMTVGKCTFTLRAPAPRPTRQKELVVELEQQAAKDDVGVSFNLIDFSAAKEYYIEAQTLDAQVTGVVEFDIPINKWLMFEKPRRTIVAVVKANTLVNLYRKERERIFAVNIRSFLGRKGITRTLLPQLTSIPTVSSISIMASRPSAPTSTSMRKRDTSVERISKSSTELRPLEP